MKRTTGIALITALACVLALAVPGASAAKRATIGLAYDELGLGDFGFNDGIQRGALEAQEQFGIKIKELAQIGPSGKVLEPGAVLHKLAKRNTDLVIGDFMFEGAAPLIAAEYPDTNFVIVAGSPGQTPSNLKTIQFALHEGGFLAGAAAALKTRTNQIGFIGGGDFVEPVLDALAGFEAGVHHIAPTADISVEFLGSFRDPALAYQVATAMYAQGIDVIWTVSGQSDPGVAEAARDSATSGGPRPWAIGTDGDLYQVVPEDARSFVLMSIVSRVDVVVFEAIASQVDGTFNGGSDFYDLARNGLDYATTGGFVDDIVPVLEDLRERIIDGTIVVPTAP